MEMKTSNKQFDDVKSSIHTEALKLADELEKPVQVPNQPEMIYIDGHRMYASQMIRRLVEELDKPELNDGGFPVKNATYWKRQYNLMSAQNDRLKSGIYHANEQIKYLESLAPQTKPLSDEEIGDCVDDYFGLMALQHKYIYDIDQVQEYGLKLARAIEERHGIK